MLNVDLMSDDLRHFVCMELISSHVYNVCLLYCSNVMVVQVRYAIAAVIDSVETPLHAAHMVFT